MKLIAISLILFVLIGCQDRGDKQDQQNRVNDPAYSPLTNTDRIATLRGVWTIQIRDYEKANHDFMESLRLQFDGSSRVRVYQRKEGRLSWLELLAIYTPYPYIAGTENTLFLHDPVLYRNGTLQVVLEPVDQNSFRFGYVRSDDFYTPEILKRYGYLSDRFLVRVDESSPFEKQINAGEPVTGQLLKDLPPPLISTENLIGSWSFESTDKDASLKISFDANKTGQIYLRIDNQTVVKSFEYVISKESREILLTSSNDYRPATTQSIFAKITISDLSSSQLIVNHFRATENFEHRRNGLNDASNLLGNSPIVLSKVK